MKRPVKGFDAPSELQRSLPFVVVRIRDTFAREAVQSDSAATRSAPESTGAAGDRERHGEAVARSLEIRTTYARGNAIARNSNARQRRRTCRIRRAAVPSQLDLLATRVQELCVTIASISKHSRAGTISRLAISAGVRRGESSSMVQNYTSRS